MSHNIKLEMCKVMVFAVVEKAGAVVMADHEEVRNLAFKKITLGDLKFIFAEFYKKYRRLIDNKIYHPDCFFYLT